MAEATKKQLVILEEIEKYVKAHKYPPTVRELAAAVGNSVSTTHDKLTTLKKNGHIKWEPERPRTLTVIRGAADGS